MTEYNINPYGNSAVMPESYPIADNLTTNSAQQALSAKQGVRLKAMVDNVQPMDYDAWAKAVRARIDNLSKTKWAPTAGTLPKTTASSYTQGTANTGLPYSSTREIDKYVGYNVSLRSFLTAVHNPYSMLYTENINGSRSASAITGKTYHGTECGAWMGIQCASFVSYCLGLMPYWLTNQYSYATSQGYMTLIGQPTAADVQLFDILWKKGHVQIVSDIQYEDGDLSKIVVTESVSQTPAVTEYTVAQFNTKFNTTTYKLYRATKKGLNMEYENVSGIEYNDDICTVAGDYAVFCAGSYIGVNYTKGSYTKMQIFRNGYLIDEETLDASAHLVNLTNDNLEYGLYTARLSNADGSSVSKPTHFEVVDALCGCSIQQDGKAKVTFSSSRGAPLWVDFMSTDATNVLVVARYVLTAEDKERGYAVIDASALATAQPTSDSSAGTSTSLVGSKVKVLFKSEYGMVPSEPILSGY